MKYHLEINQKKFDVTISGVAGNTARVMVNGQSYDVRVGHPSKPAGHHAAIRAAEATPPQAAGQAPSRMESPEVSIPSLMPGQGETVLAPIPGLILEVKVKVGEAVRAGQVVSILEAMKMENSLVTHVAGTVTDIRVQKGSEVSTGDVILIVG